MAEVDAESGAPARVERVADEDGTPVVSVTGEIDLSNVDLMRAVVDPIVSTGPDRLIFEVGGLAFMDSSAITVFLQAANGVRRVELRGAGGTVRRIVDATGLADILHLDP